MKEKSHKYGLDFPFFYGLSFVLNPNFRLFVFRVIMTLIGYNFRCDYSSYLRNFNNKLMASLYHNKYSRVTRNTKD